MSASLSVLRPRSLRLAAALVALASIGCDPGGTDPGPQPTQYLDLEPVADGLAAPVFLLEAPDGTGRLFVVDQVGLVYVVDGEGTLLPDPFLDLRDRMAPLTGSYMERGLTGMAFHPDFRTNGRLYVFYSAPLDPGAPEGYDHTTRVSEFTVSEDPDLADPASERVILSVDQPQPNYNGGEVTFGPDGYLYISLGDGGGSADVGLGHVPDWYEPNDGGNGQDIEQNLLGSILRIDVDGGDPYGIPPDNPFVGEDGLDEIWAYGFRNPARLSFDQDSELALVTDRGDERFQEVNVLERGGNYGWNVREGAECFDADQPQAIPAGCPFNDSSDQPFRDPVIDYANAELGGPGSGVVGGYVYRGDFAALRGAYVFGDYSTAGQTAAGLVLLAAPGAATPWPVQAVSFGPDGTLLHEYLLGFGQDLDGEIYVLTSINGSPGGFGGKVYRLIVGG